MAGDAEVGSIIGYLRLDRSDWDAELNAAGRKADELGRHNPDIRIKTNAPSAIAQLAAVAAATKRLQDAQGAEAVAEARLQSLRDRGVTDAGRIKAAEEAVAKARRSEAAATIALAAAQDANDRAMQKAAADTDKLTKKANEAKNTFQIGLIPALAAIAPAAVPIASVATGALIGLVPVAATVMLAVKGIENQMKAGALQGTQFAASVNTLKGELTTLETTAAGGIMTGVNKALAGSAPLFKTLNQDIGVTSTQLGNIVAGAAPALLRIFTELNPLFVTFGQLISQGAEKLDHWAQSSTGVQSFVAYVQVELPHVMSFLGNLIVLVSHLAQGLAPLGGALLTDLNLFVRALDAIPVPVLREIAPVALSAYVALLTLTKLTPGVSSMSGAIKALGNTMSLTGPRAAAFAAQQNAASLAVQAQSEAEAASLARDKANEAANAADAAAAIAESEAEINSALAEEADTAARVANEFAAAMNEQADAAEAAAARIAGSAQAAAEGVAASGEEASIGWSAMLGPLAAVGIGLTLLTSLFSSNSEQAMADTQAVNNYTQALIQSKGAIDDSVRATVAKQLADAGAFKAADQLGISTKTVTDAFLGNAQAATALNLALLAPGSGKTLDAQAKLSGIIADQSGNFKKSVKDAKDYLTAMGQNATGTDKVSAAVVQQAKLLGVSSSAYLTAQQAVQQNTQQTQAQTLAFQLENNAAGLVNQALQTMAGQNLSNAQAQTSMEQAILTATAALKTNKGALSEHSTAGLADRQAIESAVSAIQAKMQAEAQATGSSEKATTQYHANAAALLEQIGRLDGTKSAAYKYAQQLLEIPPVVKTAIDLKGDAIKKINDTAAALRGLNNKTFRTFLVVQASVKNAQALKGQDQGGPPAPNPSAAGHLLNPGHNAGGTSSWRGGWTWVGEQGPELVNLPAHSKVMPHGQSMAASEKPTVVNNIYPRASQSEREIGRAAADEMVWALSR